LTQKRGKQKKTEHLLCVISLIFRSNKLRSTLETHTTKATAVGESRLAMWGFGGEVSSRLRPIGVRGQCPRRCGNFTAFFPKIRIFKHTLVYISA